MNWITNFPDQMMAKLIYQEEYSWPSANPSYIIDLKISNPLDPWAGVGNVNATNYQLISSWYKYSITYAAKITFTVVPRNTASNPYYFYAVPYNDDTPIPIPTRASLGSMKYARWKTIGNANVKVYKMKCYWNFNKLSGLNLISKDPLTYAINNSTGLDPTKQWYLRVGQLVLDSGTAGGIPTDITIRIKFYTKFFERYVNNVL